MPLKPPPTSSAPRERPPAPQTVPRAHARTKVHLSAEIDTFKERFTASTRDLSVGGVGLDLDRPLEEAATLSISLFLVVDDIEDEGTTPMNLRAKVAWCAEAEEEGRWAAGIRFENLLPQQLEWLSRFLQAVEPG